MTAPVLPPARLTAREFDPDSTAAIAVEPLGLTPDALAQFVVESMRPGVPGWSVGVVGAIAEFVPDATISVQRRGPVIEATTTDAAFRLRVAPEVAGYTVRSEDRGMYAVIMAAPRREGEARLGVREIGPDRDAVGDGAGTLFDLGIGSATARFAVRTDDPGQVARLRAVAGEPWTVLFEALGEDLFERSPVRVVSSALARVEVHGLLPRPDGRSPDGSHTHLLASQLELGRELDVGIRLPPGLVPAATFYPGG